MGCIQQCEGEPEYWCGVQKDRNAPAAVQWLEVESWLCVMELQHVERDVTARTTGEQSSLLTPSAGSGAWLL